MVADDTPAIDVVLKADKKRTDLLQERDQLEADMKKKNKEVDMDRLQEVYEELKAIGADKAEPKARRWGADGSWGLGFDLFFPICLVIIYLLFFSTIFFTILFILFLVDFFFIFSS